MSYKKVKKVFIYNILLLLCLLLIFVYFLNARKISNKVSIKEKIKKEIASNHTKVIIIGIDGLSLNLLMPLVKIGKLPNFAKLINNGAYGTLRTIYPIISPAIWTTIATGKSVNKHSIDGFLTKNPIGYEPIVLSSNHRKTKAIWNILSEYGKTVGIVYWMVTHPPEPVLGFMIPYWGASEPGPSLTYPPAIIAEIEKKLTLPHNFGKERMSNLTGLTFDPNFEKKYPHDSEAFIQQSFYKRCLPFIENDERVFRIANFLYEKYKPDFFCLYLKGTDVLSHRYWNYCKNDGPIQKYYKIVDTMLGKILEKSDDNTTILIVSDHGFRPIDKNEILLWDLEKLFLKLGWTNYRHGEKDWKNTKVFHVGEAGKFISPLYINLRGRNPKGAINQSDYYKFRKKVVETLSKITTTSGKKLFLNVQAKSLPKPLVNGFHDYPDIIVEINPHISLKDTIVLNNRDTIQANEIGSNCGFSAFHSMEGVIIIYGNNIKRGKIIENATVFDVTPTVLYLMGFPIAKDMDGKVLKKAIQDDYLIKHPIKIISTYEEDKSSEVKQGSIPTVNKEILEELKAIGYIQ